MWLICVFFVNILIKLLTKQSKRRRLRPLRVQCDISVMAKGSYWGNVKSSLLWRHNEHDSVSNHQPRGCLLDRLFRRRPKKHQSSASLAFVWGIHRDRWIPRTKGQLRGKCFHLMTSSWYQFYRYQSDPLSCIYVSTCIWNSSKALP